MAFKIASLVLLVSVTWTVTFADTRVDIAISARDLPNLDIFEGAPDGYAVVYYAATSTDSFSRVGETVNLSDNKNPDWKEVFNFYALGNGTSNVQRLKIEIWDSDVDADDYIGFYELRLSDIVTATNNRIERELNPLGNGRVIIQGQVNQINRTTNGEKIDERFINPTKIISYPSHLPTDEVLSS